LIIKSTLRNGGSTVYPQAKHEVSVDETEKLRVAAIADIHVKEGDGAPYRDMFAEVSHEADVLVICGDLTDLGKPAEAHLLTESLRSCTIPIVAVLGNHDYECGHVDEVRAIVRGAGIHLLEGQSCIIHGVGFVGIKGFAGGFGTRMLGSFGEPAIKQFVAETVQEALCLENAMRRTPTERTVILLHYAPIVGTVEGEPPEIFPFLGCSRLAETIDRFKVSAVLHGHAHRGRYEGKTPGGIPVFNVAQQIEKPNGRPYALLHI
jgi:Icc-related predicted phosphoesterase